MGELIFARKRSNKNIENVVVPRDVGCNAYVAEAF